MAVSPHNIADKCYHCGITFGENESPVFEDNNLGKPVHKGCRKYDEEEE